MSKFTFTLMKKLSRALVGKNLGRIGFLKSLYYRIFFRTIPDVLIVNGMEMKVNKGDRFVSLDLLINGVYEKFETDLVKKEVKNGMNVIDAGANIGYFTLLLAKNVGPSGKVFAFEPDPDNFSILKENVEMNGFDNVVLVNKALSDSVGTTKLFLSKTNKGAHSILNFNKSKVSIEVETTTIDEYFKKSKTKIDFIKMDVEGAEGKVFTGMRRFLKNNRSLKLLTEFSVIGLKSSGIEPESYLESLSTEGFEVFNIEDQNGILMPVDISKVSELVQSKKSNNLFCVRGD